MSDVTPQEHPAEVLVKRRRSPSLVWIVPIVAALIAGWLAIKTINDRGPQITIRFDSATGLEAGKTKIRYRDVDIGLVEEVRLDEDLTRVLVTARMDRRAEPFLTETAQFWVVRARVTTSEVSGLGTLFSGAYIAVAPGKEGPATDHFIGLETPPVLTDDHPGRHFVLLANRLGSLDVGSPVYHRQIQVGRVVSYRLDDDGQDIELGVFIDAPHDQRINGDTRFWNADGFDFTLDANGLKVDSESLVTIVAGGIAFANPDPTHPGAPVEENARFQLYPNRTSSVAPEYRLKQKFLMYFDESVRGLTVGAPVEFRGIPVGQVTSVALEFDTERMEFRIPVVVEIEPERIRFTGKGAVNAETLTAELIKRGLRAQLKLVNMLTGQLAVSLRIDPGAPKVPPAGAGAYPQMPTVPTPFEELSGTVTQLVKKLNELPIEQIASGVNRDLKTLDDTLKSFDATLTELRKLSANFDGRLAPAAVKAVEELRNTLKELQENFGSQSPLSGEAHQALAEFSKAARSLRNLTDYLERHPESLLQGKKGSEP